MRQHWETHLGYPTTHPLEESWAQLAQAFIDHVKAHDTVGAEVGWTVLRLPTGTGKTEGTILYSAMLSSVVSKMPQLHPGILIVTRMIKDANRIATDINGLSKKQSSNLGNSDAVAVAYHTEMEEELTRRDLRQFPVLVITHKAYENALDGLESNASPTSWDYFHDYLDRKRKLVIIDEAIDLILESRVSGDDVRSLIGLIPSPLYEEFHEEVYWLNKLQERFKELSENGGSEPVANGVLYRQPMIGALMGPPEEDNHFPPQFRALREALKEYRSTVAPFSKGKRSASEDEVRRGLDELIRDVNAILQNPWMWQTKHEGKLTLNTAKLLIPDDVKGAIVLDATAGENVFYDVFERAKRLPQVPGTRRYDSVTLHVSKGQRTGKISMRKKAKEDITLLVAELAKWAKDRHVLVITHAEREQALRRATKRLSPEKGFTISIDHWGAINGVNDYRDCDTVVLYGLNHFPPTWPINVFFACQGVQSDEWLSSKEARRFGTHKDIQGALKVGQLVSNLVQGINRARCRNVVDRDGNCLRTDVYILLPKRHGEAILGGIKNAMSGIQVVDWGFSKQKREQKKTKYDGQLIEFFREMEPGKTPVVVVKEKYSIPDTTFERIRERVRARSPKDSLGTAMIEYGVFYDGTGRMGKTPRAYFLKGE
jgi:hypothetical protein